MPITHETQQSSHSESSENVSKHEKSAKMISKHSFSDLHQVKPMIGKQLRSTHSPAYRESDVSGIITIQEERKNLAQSVKENDDTSLVIKNLDRLGVAEMPLEKEFMGKQASVQSKMLITKAATEMSMRLEPARVPAMYSNRTKML